MAQSGPESGHLVRGEAGQATGASDVPVTGMGVFHTQNSGSGHEVAEMSIIPSWEPWRKVKFEV